MAHTLQLRTMRTSESQPPALATLNITVSLHACAKPAKACPQRTLGNSLLPTASQTSFCDTSRPMLTLYVDVPVKVSFCPRGSALMRALNVHLIQAHAIRTLLGTWTMLCMNFWS